MVHRGFKRSHTGDQLETMAPFNTEKREVYDTPDLTSEVSRRMGDRLLRGHTMLDALCDCGGILMEDRAGVRTCVACEVREEPQPPAAAATTTPSAPAVASVAPAPSSSSASIDNQVAVDRAELNEYVSTNMGRLLIKGHTMLDAYCACSCILMEDREGVRTCLACQFRERKAKARGTVAAAAAAPTVPQPDYGFHVVEIPLNADLPSSSKASKLDMAEDYGIYEEEEEARDPLRDAITARMGELLLKGVAMLDEYCDQEGCSGIMMQERSGNRLCVECEVRNGGKSEEKPEVKDAPVKEEPKKKEEKPAKKVAFAQDSKADKRMALPASEWKMVTTMTIEAKLIWLSSRLAKTEDYDEMAKILDLIEKAAAVTKNL